MIFIHFCIIGILTPGLVRSYTGQYHDPHLEVTCERDWMTIVATAEDGDDYSRIDLSANTGDYEHYWDGSMHPTACRLSPALTYSDTCGDDVGPCVSTLRVNLTAEPYSTHYCSPNTAPYDEYDDPQAYTKRIHWRKGRVINTDENNEDGDFDHQNSTATLVTYRVTCQFPLSWEVSHITPGPGMIFVDLLSYEDTNPVTIERPEIDLWFAHPTEDPHSDYWHPPDMIAVMGQIIRLTAKFRDDTGYWQHMVVRRCVASGGYHGYDQQESVDIISNSCPEYVIDGKQIVTGYAYPETETDGVVETKRMNLDFRAFRIGTMPQLYMHCDIVICPAKSEDTFCMKPITDSTLDTECISTPPLKRYQSLWSRSGKPQSYTSTLSTVIILSDQERVTDNSAVTVAAGYTCLAVVTFASVVSILIRYGF